MGLQDHLASLRDIGRGVARGAASLPADLAWLSNYVLPLPGRGERLEASERMSERAKALATALVGEKEGAGIAQTGGELAGPPLKTGLKGLAMVGALGPDLIKGWKWRNAADVQKELGLTEVPAHVQKEFGPFMQQQAARAKSGDLDVDDLQKAYAITTGSIGRRSRDIPYRGNIRPEDYIADWLLSSAGRDYRAAAQQGVADPKAISNLTEGFAPFGKAESLGRDLTYGAENLGAKAQQLGPALGGSVEDWHKFAQDIPWIGPAKSGFLASLLGRGDIPVLDARQLALHAPDTKHEAGKFFRRGGGEGGNQAVDRLAARQKAMALALDPSLEPFYQSLTHHSVWDKVAGTVTPHAEITEAMLDLQRRGSPPRFSAKHGIGATPNNRNIDYMGFQTTMPASKFLELAPPVHHDPESLAFLQKALTEGRPLGQPFLDSRWNEARKTWDITGHEGRHRSHSIAQMFGPESEIPVHVFPGGGMRARHITDEMRTAPFVDQTTVRREADEAYRREKLAKLLRGEED
jgi:hypothetical protein